MNALIVAPLGRSCEAGFYVADAFKEADADCETYLFDYRSVAAKKGVYEMNRDLSGYAKQVKPDVTVILKGEAMDLNTVAGLPGKKATWYFDLEVNPNITAVARESDVFFLHVNDQPTLDYYRGQGVNVKVLEQGLPEKEYYPVDPDPAYASDVCFIGSNKPGRDEYLDEVFRACRRHDWRLKIWGNGWEGSPFESVWQGKDIYHGEFSLAVCSAKVNLGIGYGDYISRDLSFRLYQILGCRGFLAHNYVKPIEALYSVDDLLMFEDLTDIESTLEYCMDYPVVRSATAASGYKTTLAKHTYTHRVKKLLKEVGL